MMNGRVITNCHCLDSRNEHMKAAMSALNIKMQFSVYCSA